MDATVRTIANPKQMCRIVVSSSGIVAPEVAVASGRQSLYNRDIDWDRVPKIPYGAVKIDFASIAWMPLVASTAWVTRRLAESEHSM